ncbi:MAG: hypothetical protein HYW85_07250 [Deltaproteobacteria bacterium]|nr:hypothetical protein [Deltaproteobacteria bacterium]
MGNALFKKVVQLSGLPPRLIKSELTDILKRIGIKPKKVTEPVLRKAMATYLRDIVNKTLKEV